MMRRLIAVTLLLSAPALFAAAAKKPDETALAKVNGDAVTVQDLVDQFTARHGGHAKFLGGNAEARSFLSIIIDERLLLQEAYDIGLDQDPAVKTLVEETEKNEAAKYLINSEIDQKVTVPKEDVRKIWKESLSYFLAVRQIAVETRQEAEEVRAAIVQGADFDSLARGCSRVESRLNGGALLVNWGQFEPAWEEVVFKLKPGEVSPVIATRNGFEVVIVDDRVDAPRPELGKVDSQIEGVLRMRRTEARKKAFSEELWAKYHVVLKPLDRTALLNLVASAPDTVVATWDNGGKLTVRELLNKEDLNAWRGYPPARAAYELDARLRATINDPLVAIEAATRNIAEHEPVASVVTKARERAVESLLFRDHIYKEVKVDDDDVRGYYAKHKNEFEEPEQRHVTHIMLSTEADASAVRAKLAAGADFSELAKKSSRDFVSAMSGGELGWITPEKVPAGFKDVLSLAVGDYSKPLQSKNGWHIVKVLEIKPKRQLELSEVKPKVETAVRAEKQSEARAFWVKRLRAAAKIEIDDKAIAAFVKANEFKGETPPAPQHAMQ